MYLTKSVSVLLTEATDSFHYLNLNYTKSNYQTVSALAKVGRHELLLISPDVHLGFTVIFICNYKLRCERTGHQMAQSAITSEVSPQTINYNVFA